MIELTEEMEARLPAQIRVIRQIMREGEERNGCRSTE